MLCRLAWVQDTQVLCGALSLLRPAQGTGVYVYVFVYVFLSVSGYINICGGWLHAGGYTVCPFNPYNQYNRYLHYYLLFGLPYELL